MLRRGEETNSKRLEGSIAEGPSQEGYHQADLVKGSAGSSEEDG